MSIAFDKVKPGMVLYDRHTYKMGSTTIRTIGEWTVKVLEVNSEKRRALCSWNGNPPEWRWESYFKGLFDWSMYDKSVAEMTKGMVGSVTRVRKLSKAEREARKKGDGDGNQG